MEPLIKNLPHARPFPLKDQVGYEPGKVVSLTLAQRPGVGMTLFAFDAGEAISTHAAPGDAMATILEGTAQITIDGVPHTLNAGEAVIMPAGIPHAVQAVTPFKMYLVVAKLTPPEPAESFFSYSISSILSSLFFAFSSSSALRAASFSNSLSLTC